MNSRNTATSPIPRSFSLRKPNNGARTPAIFFSGERFIYLRRLRRFSQIVFRGPCFHLCKSAKSVDKFFSSAAPASLRRACWEFPLENGTAVGTHRHSRQSGAYADNSDTTRPSLE